MSITLYFLADACAFSSAGICSLTVDSKKKNSCNEIVMWWGEGRRGGWNCFERNKVYLSRGAVAEKDEIMKVIKPYKWQGHSATVLLQKKKEKKQKSANKKSHTC